MAAEYHSGVMNFVLEMMKFVLNMMNFHTGLYPAAALPAAKAEGLGAGTCLMTYQAPACSTDLLTVLADLSSAGMLY